MSRLSHSWFVPSAEGRRRRLKSPEKNRGYHSPRKSPTTSLTKRRPHQPLVTPLHCHITIVTARVIVGTTAQGGGPNSIVSTAATVVGEVAASEKPVERSIGLKPSLSLEPAIVLDLSVRLRKGYA